MIFIKGWAVISLFLVLGICTSAFSQVTTTPVDTSQLVPVPKPARPDFSERVLERLKTLSKRKNLIGRGLDLLFDFDRKAPLRGIDPELLRPAYAQHNYKVVRHIEIRRLSPFGYSINDTTRTPRNFFEKAGNSFHIKTHNRRIRGQLLFRRGELLEPGDLQESERLLRQTEHILDARIFVNEKSTTKDSVDVIIVSKDVFNLSGSGSFNTNTAAGRVRLNDVNFLGLGHQFRNVYQFGLDSIRRSWTYTGSYTVQNIYNTFITGHLLYRNEIHYQQRGINFYRDFYTANTRYAGALNVNYYSYPIHVQGIDDRRVRQNITFTKQDYWLGRSFKLKSYDLGFENPGRIITAGRIIATNYANSPNPDYQNNILFIGGFGFSYRKYYKDRFLFGFGRTEDIPSGNLIAVSAGYEKGDFYNRRYIGGKMAFGKYATNFGYLYMDAQFDSYIRGKNWEQGEFSSEILYFTKLLKVGTWQWRHLIWNRTTWGFNRKFAEDILNINRNNGIRGFSIGERGTRRFVVNYESSLFTPFSFLGFRLALVNFADFAWLSDGNHTNPFDYKPYQGYGIGFRFRNEYMAINTIQVLLGYYPQGRTPIKSFNSTRPYYDFNDFRFSQPIISDFR
ncbi:hypothetical protein [Adhaeribacter aquaticus]|uniref:hypothetical protein n=1 Tax=Adhaeribacter aquaticus TaxID=299567 RepID=UPI000425E314|nr:hypothetical protein [Adhaeribacter aquaticus]